jgi:hypothetical protein
MLHDFRNFDAPLPLSVVKNIHIVGVVLPPSGRPTLAVICVFPKGQSVL